MIAAVVDLLCLKRQHIHRTRNHTQVTALAALSVYVNCSYNFSHNDLLYGKKYYFNKYISNITKKYLGQLIIPIFYTTLTFGTFLTDLCGRGLLRFDLRHPDPLTLQSGGTKRLSQLAETPARDGCNSIVVMDIYTTDIRCGQIRVTEYKTYDIATRYLLLTTGTEI